MDLIQNWTSENKKKLRNFIIKECDCKFKDITIVGSRVTGNFHQGSDMDVVAWIENILPREIHHCEFNDIHVSITFRDYSEFERNIWGKYKYSLAKYSVIDDRFYPGNSNHLLHHHRLRKLIRDTGGWNVPFEQFEKENAYLLD